MLVRLVDHKDAPHVPVFDKASQFDGTWFRVYFEWDAPNNQCTFPEGHIGQPLDLIVTAGLVSDYIGARALLCSLPKVDWLLGDRGYDADSF